ncbi:MAG TPA: hypothetical protein PLR25_02545 [Planctomycetaceae bacterium]|nr:hypothetical protein [Planctomycetaceae bacterium]
MDEDPAVNLSPRVIKEVREYSNGGRVLLLDGFTCTADDTPKNQAEYPQNTAQKEGLGFPILRCVTLISLYTGLLFDVKNTINSQRRLKFVSWTSTSNARVSVRTGLRSRRRSLMTNKFQVTGFDQSMKVGGWWSWISAPSSVL